MSSPKQFIHIAVVMMLKNEEKRLQVTLDSIVSIASSLVIYDTGSTDSTIQILENFSHKNKIPLRIKHGEFKDFATSRNILLDFADTFEDIHYLLLLDCNDELKNPAGLKKFAYENFNKPDHCWLMCQQWFAGDTIKYYNIRFLRPRKGWRYKGVVHEFIYNTITPDLYIRQKIDNGVFLYQDRTLDDDKTGKRFTRDYDLLISEYQRDSTDARTVFYLAQTCNCMKREEEAYKYYEIRSNMEGGFAEERFEAMIRCGEFAHKYTQVNKQLEEKQIENTEWFSHFRWETALGWYMKAMTVFKRIEPLIAMGKYYKDIGHMDLAYMFIHNACMMEYPKDSLLFVNKHQFEYERWHLMGIIAFYVGQHAEGYEACMTAIKVANQGIDKHNLEFYKKALGNKKKHGRTK